MADSADIARRATEKLRLPPHSVEAEQALLGGLMLDQRAWDQIADVVTADDLYRADHRLIFGAIGTLVERNQPPDAVTVSEHLQRTGQLEAAGGLPYLARLVEDTPSAANIRAYARIVRERAMLRQLIEIGGDIAASAHATEGLSVDEIVDRAEQLVFEIADGGAKRGQGFVPLKQILPLTIDRLDMLSHSTSDITGISSGFADMDRMTAGLQRGDLIIVAGRPSMGKCVVAGTRILDPETGALRTIDACVRERRGRLVSLNAQGRLQPAQASDFVDDGIKPVYEVTTALGRRIAVTASHPFLTPAGWRPLAALRPGIAVAVPRELPFFGRADVDESLVKLAAYFSTNGDVTGGIARFTHADARIREDFARAVAFFPGVRCRVETNGGTRAPSVRVVRDPAAVDTARGFAARFRELCAAAGSALHAAAELAGATAAASAVRRSTSGSSAPAAAALRLSAGLGVGFDARAASARASTRKQAENPVTAWLSSLGLWGKPPREKRVPGIVFEWPRRKLALFLNRVFACGGDIDVQNGDRVEIAYSTVSEALARDIQHLLLRLGVVATLRSRSTGDQDPVRAAYELRIGSRTDVARFVDEIGIFGREEQAAEALRISGPLPGDAERANLAASGIRWDCIETIEYAGERQVYDLTVPEHHNFVAEDIVVHNTTLAVNIAENAAIGSSTPTAIFSMEMSAEQLAFRMIGSIGRVNQSRLRTGKLSDEDWSRIDSAVSMMSNAPIFIDDSPALTPTEVRARARRLKREHGLGLIVVDYLQLMRVAGTTENRATEISEISRSLKALAKELSCPVIALSQLNRSVEQRTDKKPVMSDLRECVTGETLVCLTDGRRVPIRDLVGTAPQVWAVDDKQRLIEAQADCVWHVGRKQVYRVRLASGRHIRATAEHRLLGPAGWVTVSELRTGTRLALARRIPQPADHSARSDLVWDRVTEVVAGGEEEVFDLTVPGPANWLADGIATHNSGAIEQDADLIVFIYREEVYDPDTPRKGIADIIIAKQRNGPVGEFHLTFLGEFTKFENLVAEAYGEGVF